MYSVWIAFWMAALGCQGACRVRLFCCVSLWQDAASLNSEHPLISGTHMACVLSTAAGAGTLCVISGCHPQLQGYLY